jgi:hypothetical protein
MRFFQSRTFCLHFACGLLGLAMLYLMTAPAFSQSEALLQRYPQALNMAGYVLNTETNMNRIYSRQLGYDLLPLEEDLIQIEGPLIPPVPPVGQSQRNPFLLRAPLSGN